MSAKINYTRQELTALKSQIDQQIVALGSLLNSARQDESLLDAREAFAEEPNRDTIEAKYSALSAGVSQINSMAITVPSQVDFMAGYDAAT